MKTSSGNIYSIQLFLPASLLMALLICNSVFSLSSILRSSASSGFPLKSQKIFGIGSPSASHSNVNDFPANTN